MSQLGVHSKDKVWKRYFAYKESGVEWLGEIPEGWSVLKLKYLIKKLESGVSVNAADFPASKNDIGVLKTSCVYTREFRSQENKTVFIEEINRVKCKVQSGSLIISRMNTPDLVGAAAYVDKDYNNLYLPDRLWQTVFFDDKKQFVKYLHYFMGLKGFTEEIAKYAEGASGSMQNISQEDFLSIKVLIFDFAEQQQIAQFLDRETSRIDTLVAKKERFIGLLQEKRTALISHAVTKGLNPDVPMKDSGVEWLGEVPESWKVFPTKRIFRLIVNLAPIDNNFELLSIYTDIGVRPRKELEAKGNKATTTDGYLMVKKGDIIVNKLLAWMGAIGLSNYDGVTSPAYDILRAIKELDPKYYDYLFRCGICFIEFRRNSRGIMDMRLRLYFEEFGQILMPYPPLLEQLEIAQFLDKQTSKIDTLIEKTRLSINYLKEHRTALISAAVTGKIDVRTG